MDKRDVLAGYQRALDATFGAGEEMRLRRYSGIGANRALAYEATVRVRVMSASGAGGAPAPLAGTIQEHRQVALVYAPDVAAAAFPEPIRRGDQLVRADGAGKVLAIDTVDDATRRIGGMLVAYECEVSG